MQCTLVCDCGERLDIESTSAQPECPACNARYAVTFTTIRQPDRSLVSD